MRSTVRAAVIPIALIISLLLFLPCAAESGSASVMGDILDYCGYADPQCFSDVFLPSNVGGVSEWYLFALAHGGYDFERYRSSLDLYLSEHEISAPTSRLKFALAYIASGDPDNRYISDSLYDSVGKQGIMSLVYGLHVLNNIEGSDKQQVISQILALQKEDGGFAVSGNLSDPDVTSMVIQSLAPCTDDAEAREAVEKALSLLSEMQRDNGAYASFGAESAESCAQAVIALCSLGIDPRTDERFIKNGISVYDAMLSFACGSGAFAHSRGGGENPLATAEVFCALASVERSEGGGSCLFVFNREGDAPLDGSGEEGESGEEYGSDEGGNSGEEDESEGGSVTTLPGDQKEEPEKDDDGNESGDNGGGRRVSYKIHAIIAIIGLGALACVLLLILKKKNYKNFVFIAGAVIFLCVLVLITDFSSPEEYYKPEQSEGDITGTVTLSIDCLVLEDVYGEENCVILEKSEYPLYEGDSVYDILIRAAKENGILIDSSGISDMVYISGIATVYEYEHGELSGWMYYVNGESPSVGCKNYIPGDGDHIEWKYTREIGNDISN